MTVEELDAIQKRADAATPGPWAYDGEEYDIRDYTGEEICIIRPVTCDDANDNGEFIAHARSDVPALLAEVKRLQAQVDALLHELAE